MDKIAAHIDHEYPRILDNVITTFQTRALHSLVTGLFTSTKLFSDLRSAVACSKINIAWSSVSLPSRKKCSFR